MKQLIILITFITICKLSFAQIETGAINSKDVIHIKIEPEVSNQVLPKTVKGIKVIDSREDTSTIGYYYGITGFAKRYGKYCFEGSADNELANWISHYLNVTTDTISDDIILMVLRKFRVSSEITEKIFDNGHQGQGENGWEEGVLAKMDFYIKRNGLYYPVYRYDSLQVMEKKLQNNVNEFITIALKNSLIKLFTLNVDELISKARKLSFDDIVKYSKKYMAMPILSDAVYKKGVYKSFEEFKNNNPSIEKYEFRKGKMGDFLYVKERDKEYPDRTAWGFCDGKNIFINSADKFSELTREQNTFYFKGIKSVDRITRHRGLKTSGLNLIMNTGEKRTAYKLDIKYYQIDMETGEIY